MDKLHEDLGTKLISTLLFILRMMSIPRVTFESMIQTCVSNLGSLGSVPTVAQILVQQHLTL